MKSQPEKSPEGTPRTPFEAMFAALPPLNSSDYLDYLRTAPPESLPPQVLARAYRQLCSAKRGDAMHATLDRLFSARNLRRIRRLAEQQVPNNQATYTAEDLVQAALEEILVALPKERGALAETAWVLFCEQRFADAWRKIFGKKGTRLTLQVGGERVPITFAKPNPDSHGGTLEETGDAEDLPDDPVEMTDGFAAPWHPGIRESDLPAVERIIEETIAGIPDLVMRRVAEDQAGDDPSPISAGASKGGKPPLTEQTGLSRHQLTRMLRNIRARLAGALLAEEKIKIDMEWLRGFVRGEKSGVGNKSRRQAR